MSWLSTLPGFFVALLVLLGPGLLWGAVFGLRRLTLLALAGPLSVSGVVIASESAALAGVRWSIVPLLGVTAAVALLLWLIRRRFGEAVATDPGGPLRHSLAAWAVAAIPVGLITLWIFGDPENIAQSHDNIFHLNAVRYIAETGNASSPDLGYLGTRAATFYPAGWHAIVSVVLLSSGLSVPAAINVVNLAIVLAIWCIGCLFLVTRVTGERRTALLSAAVLSGAYSSFPYLLYEFGVVYPFMLSIALLPAVLGLVVQLMRVGAPLRTTTAANLLLLLGVLPGLALAHPSSVVGALGLSLPMVLAAAYSRLRRSAEPTWRTLTPTAVFLVVLAVVWMRIRPSRGSSDNWDELGNAGLALIEVVLHSPLFRPPAFLVAGLTLVGAAFVLRRKRHRWALALYGFAAMLFVVANWKEAPDLRWIVAGVWYNDYFRISAMLPVAGIIIASLGAVALVDAAKRQPKVSALLREGSRERGAVVVALVVVGVLLAPLGAVQRGVAEAAAKYRFTQESQLLTVDELALIERLPETVEEGSGIVGVPLTGASLSYSYTGIPTLLPYGTLPASAAGKIIYESLDELTTNPEVCAAAQEMGVEYVLDFGISSVHPGKTEVVPGLQDLTPENGFERVDSEGEAALYRITGC
ncbi:hypothetical protein ASH00_06960 [Arthrobacter sp. Soil782]|uniref:DUF6541 family protein n=1 Tax=Arthrobacter sp. Soil782 TaxID=1736410 RepID=UPI0006F55BFA|nr:DUF6541 family protein [Arthrobacter sp. Soil782]KRF09358.1 hypothetical protein ASH00_06960 [Arthrobacter sp. Soil782]